MPSNDILVLVAELAVAIAGFSSVVVALARRPVAEWPPGDQRNLRILLQVSGIAIFFSLFPLILQRGIATPSFWNIALAVYGIAHLVDVSTFLFRPVHGESQVPPAIGFTLSLFSIGVAALGSATMAEVTYLGVLVWHLGVAGMGFAFLLFRRRDSAA
jgi:Na+/H+ antiporter NhaA